MEIFKSESDLVRTLDLHDSLVLKCVDGELNFRAFCDKYHSFYYYYALDGHESDDEERQLLVKYESRILPHRIIATEILGRVCSDEDSTKPAYIKAGRFGSDVAKQLLTNVAINHLRKTT